MKYSIRYGLNVRRHNTPEDVAGIRARVSWCCLTADLHTGYSVEPVHWDSRSGSVFYGARNKYGQTAGEINAGLAHVSSVIRDLFSRYDLIEHRFPSPDELRADFAVAMGRVERPVVGVFEALDIFTQEQGALNGWSDSTYKKFATLRGHLRAGCPSVSFDSMLRSDADLQRLVRHLHESGMRNTTISKNCGLLRWFLRWAKQAGYYAGDLGTTFRPRLKGTDGALREIVFLEWDELMYIYGLDLSSVPYLGRVRDVFCFCCFTGLRYSDVATLRRCDVSGESIRVVTRKTADSLSIELNRYSRAILDRWRGVSLPRGLALPAVSNQKTNAFLKDLGDYAGLCRRVRRVWYEGSTRKEEVLQLRQMLTSHCGRRTFVVNALRLGIPAEVVMRWTGHSDYDSMKPYMAIVDKAKQEAMARFDSFSGDE